MPSAGEARRDIRPTLVVAADAAGLAREAADRFAAVLARKPSATLVLPTGHSPLGLYAELAARVRAGQLDLGSARIVTLDEYAGLAKDDGRRLAGWLARALFQPAGLALERIEAFRSDAPEPAAECDRMERIVRRGIDLCILGLGPNGHLGFNEPGSAFDSPTRLVSLTPESIASNAAYWGGSDAVPPRGYTIGLGALSRAAGTLLLVLGRHKAEILARSLEGPVGEDVPATILRSMDGVTVVADRDAASRLRAAEGSHDQS